MQTVFHTKNIFKCKIIVENIFKIIKKIIASNIFHHSLSFLNLFNIDTFKLKILSVLNTMKEFLKSMVNF